MLKNIFCLCPKLCFKITIPNLCHCHKFDEEVICEVYYLEKKTEICFLSVMFVLFWTTSKFLENAMKIYVSLWYLLKSSSNYCANSSAGEINLPWKSLTRNYLFTP